MKINEKISCTVEECKYHAKDKNYCSLDHITVTKNSTRATHESETDCHSFEAGLK